MAIKKRRDTLGFPRTGDQGGFSLIEVMVVGGIMLTLGLGAATLMDQQSKQFKNLRTYANRDALVADLKSQTSQLYMLYNSVGGVVADPANPGQLHPTAPNVNPAMAASISAANRELYDCLWGTGACNTTSTNPVVTARWRDFYLVPTTAQDLDRNNAIGGPAGPFVLDTTPGSYSFTPIPAQRPAFGATDALPEPAIRFDQNGRKCAPNETVGVCPNVVRTQFQVACKAGAVTCVHEGIEQINFRFVVHNLLSGQTTPQGVVPAMRDKTGQGQVTWEQIEKSLNGTPPTNECQPGSGEVRVSRDGAPTPVCARARDQDITTCIAPRVLRVGPNAAGTATQLHCELPFPAYTALAQPIPETPAPPVGNVATMSARAVNGECPPRTVVTGMNAAGELQCGSPLRGNSAPTPAISSSNGRCTGTQFVKAVGFNGSAECWDPLVGNTLQTAPFATQGQSGTKGRCAPGSVVSQVNADGSVSCLPKTEIFNCRDWTGSGSVNLDSQSFADVSCPGTNPIILSASVIGYEGGMINMRGINAGVIQQSEFSARGYVSYGGWGGLPSPKQFQVHAICCERR